MNQTPDILLRASARLDERTIYTRDRIAEERRDFWRGAWRRIVLAADWALVIGSGVVCLALAGWLAKMFMAL